MAARLDTVIELVHACEEAALASHSEALPGHPFASAILTAPDEHHRPLFLISGLAEHTRNLMRDPRASVLLRRDSQTADRPRVTLIGGAAPVVPDGLLLARYLRYQPEAERFVALGDFALFRLEPEKIRVVGGFAQAGWLDGKAFLRLPHLPLDVEAALIGELHPALPAGIRLLGIDRHGVDLRDASGRRRTKFPSPALKDEQLPAAVRQAVGA